MRWDEYFRKRSNVYSGLNLNQDKAADPRQYNSTVRRANAVLVFVNSLYLYEGRLPENFQVAFGAYMGKAIISCKMYGQTIGCNRKPEIFVPPKLTGIVG